MVFPVVMYGCESWTVKKAEHRRTGVGEDSWESLGLQEDPTSLSYRKSVLNIHWKNWCLSWNSNTLATWCEELTHLKRPWCWGRLKAGGEGDDSGWDGWIASLTQWTWVWVNSGSWWWTDRPGVLQSMGSQSRTRLSDWTTVMRLWQQIYVLFSHSVMSDSVTPWTAARQASLSLSTSCSLLRLMSAESVMPSNHLILWSKLCLKDLYISLYDANWIEATFLTLGLRDIFFFTKYKGNEVKRCS